MGAIGAAMTAFYMTRLMSLTFWGKSRVSKDVHPHESPALMTVPLIVLGVLSVVGGWIGIPHVISEILPAHVGNTLENWLEPLIASVPNTIHAEASQEWMLMGISVMIALISAATAYHFYVQDPEKPKKVAQSLGGFYKLVANKYLVDEAYYGFIINPLIGLSKNIWYYVDVNFIDKATYLISDLVRGGGSFVKATQNGNIQQYAMYIAIGLVATLTFIIMR
jgi:NADH-quinone oxidoreductase subunit L